MNGVYPASLRIWEPQPDTVSWLRIHGDLVSVRLERDPVTKAPLLWRGTVGNETFPCADYKLWCPRWSDWP